MACTCTMYLERDGFAECLEVERCDESNNTCRAVEHGLHKLGYDRIKPEQLTCQLEKQFSCSVTTFQPFPQSVRLPR